MPMVGFGSYSLQDGSTCEQAGFSALIIGYRLIGAAAIYSHEESIGRAIKKNVKPNEILVITKLLPPDNAHKKSKALF